MGVPACRQTDRLVSHALSPCDPRSRWWSLVQIHLATPAAGVTAGTQLMRAYFCYGKGGRSCQQDRAEIWTLHVFLANWGGRHGTLTGWWQPSTTREILSETVVSSCPFVAVFFYYAHETREKYNRTGPTTSSQTFYNCLFPIFLHAILFRFAAYVGSVLKLSLKNHVAIYNNALIHHEGTPPSL